MNCLLRHRKPRVSAILGAVDLLWTATGQLQAATLPV